MKACILRTHRGGQSAEATVKVTVLSFNAERIVDDTLYYFCGLN